MLRASSELIEGLLGRVREKLLDPASTSTYPLASDSIPVPSPRPKKEVRADAAVSFRDSPPELHGNRLLLPTEMMAPASFFGTSNTATFHAGAFTDDSPTALSIPGELSGLDSSLGDGSPLWCQWASPGDQLQAPTSNWEHNELELNELEDVLRFSSPFATTSPFAIDMEL
jgi:hypothetical protein